MTDFSSPLTNGGHLPNGYPTGKQYAGGIAAWKAARIVDVMVVGFPEDTKDAVSGTIPAGKPLSLAEAARAHGIQQRGARRLWADPDFQRAFATAVAAYRDCLEPGNLRVALSIRDDLGNAPKERLKAAEFLRGPKVAAGVTVNVAQDNRTVAMPAGYVINLSGKPARSEPKMIEADDPAITPRRRGGR